MAATLGTLNPFRYRGYVYDEETGLYYLRSRYYNPTWGRFINADSTESILYKSQQNSLVEAFMPNLFSYVSNNPITYIDQTGCSRLYAIPGYKNWYYRIDYDFRFNDQPHIHIIKPNGRNWVQKQDGSPYEEKNSRTLKGSPPKEIRDWLRKIKDRNDKDKHDGGGSAGPGWDWDVTYGQGEDSDNSTKIVTDAPQSTVVSTTLTGIGFIGLSFALGGVGMPIIVPGVAEPWLQLAR